MKKLTFDHFRVINVTRCEGAFFPLKSKDGPWWGNAMAGECGEACNVVKKIDRDGLTQEKLSDLANELADVVTYVDLLAAYFDIDLAKAVIAKFDAVSARVGSDLTLREESLTLDTEPEVLVTIDALGVLERKGALRSVELIDRAHLAPLQAEIEHLRAGGALIVQHMNDYKKERDQRKARCDELEGLLREVVALDPRGEFVGWQLDGRIDAALSKPA